MTGKENSMICNVNITRKGIKYLNANKILKPISNEKKLNEKL
jgi:hypothetical protein